MKEINQEIPKTKGIVSVKLNEEVKSALTTQAEKEGISISDLLRKKLTEEKKAILPIKEENSSELSTESLLNIDSIVEEKFSSIERHLMELQERLAASTTINPIKDYLKKLAGETPENPATFTEAEDKAFKTVVSAMRAETIENLLLEHNSVPIYTLFQNEIQRRTFKEMVEKRNEIVSEKMPSLNQVFMKAIAQAFADDAKSVYNRNLFKATYGMTYEEFRAVFFEQ